MRISEPSFNPSDSYDLVVASCGYETRSTYIARLGATGARRIAFTYPGPADAISSSRATYASFDWEVRDFSFRQAASDLTPGSRLLVDISSMPRTAIASIVQWLAENSSMRCVVDFFYAPGEYATSSEAARREEDLTAGPVSQFFRGDVRPATIPITLVVGLGLEPHRAIGLVELLEPSRLWALTGTGGDSRFDEDIASVRDALLSAVPTSRVLEYDLWSLAQIYMMMESLVYSLSPTARIIIAPSGPKILSLSALLVSASTRSSRPAIWRVGGVKPSQPRDVREAGEVAFSRVEFEIEAGSSDAALLSRD